MPWRLLTREQWGAPSPRLGYWVPLERRTEVVHHHLSALDSDLTRDVWETVAECAAAMRGLTRGNAANNVPAGDVPYNYVPFPMADGTLLIGEGRGLMYTGAHTPGHNTAGYGLGWAVDGRCFDPTPYVAAANDFCYWLREKAGPQLSRHTAHNMYLNTTCPGPLIRAAVDDGRFRFEQAAPGPREEDSMKLVRAPDGKVYLVHGIERIHVVGSVAETYKTLLGEAVPVRQDFIEFLRPWGFSERATRDALRVAVTQAVDGIEVEGASKQEIADAVLAALAERLGQ